MTYYAGADLSWRTVNLRLINDRGEPVAETKLDSEVTDIIAWPDDLGLDEAENVCCALKHAEKHGSPYRLTYGCGGLVSPGPTARKNVTHAKTRPTICHQPWGLEMRARFEEQAI